MSDAPFLTATRDSYNAVAAEYTATFAADLDGRPLDRALLAGFAELVRGTGNTVVADVGCGPGRITILLHQLGLQAFGVDLSPGMVALARGAYPHLRFEVGSMLTLPLPDASLGGLLAYYSIIHLPWERRPEAFAEFHRVLIPGGQLMVAFQVGDDRAHYAEAFGKQVHLDFHRQQPDDVVELLRAAGFELRCTVVKQAELTDKTPQSFVMVRKPAPAACLPDAQSAGAAGDTDPPRG